MTDINDVLQERAKTHGNYDDHARISQTMKDAMRSEGKWEVLRLHEAETLEMIAHKIGRILAGDPHFEDHWRDIAGYATLSADRNATVVP